MTRRTDLCLLAVAAVWGSSYLATKEIATAETIFVLLVVRFALAATVLAAVGCRKLPGLTRAEVVSGVAGGGLLVSVCVAETYGVTMTSASNAGLIMALTIVATPAMQRQRVGHRFYLAAALAVIGCALLTQSGGLTVPRTGDMVMVIAALLRAVHVTVMARFSDGRGIDSARTTLVQLLTVAAVASALSVASGQAILATTAAYGPAEWALVGYLALACTVFAFLAQLRALGTSSPARVSLLVGTEPLWAAILGVALAGDPVTAAGIAGAVLVVAGTGWGRMVLGYGSRGVARSAIRRPTRSRRLQEKLPSLFDRALWCAAPAIIKFRLEFFYGNAAGKWLRMCSVRIVRPAWATRRRGLRLPRWYPRPNVTIR